MSSNKLSRETELARFMRQLSKNKIVVLKKDEAASEFIKALGVAVAKSNAELYGLSVRNVYGFNAENLLKSKKLFSMGDNDFQGYTETMAKKANNEKSEGDTQPIVFVLFIDDLGSDIDVGPIMENLSFGKSHVVVVTSSPSKFKNTSAFVSSGLDLMSGFFVAKAVVEAIDGKINASLVVEPLVKLYYGLKSRPDQMNLISLPEAAKEMLLRLRNNSNPSHAEINNAAKDALAASKDKIPVKLAIPSHVLNTSLSAVEAQIDSNRYYFLEKGKSTGTNLEEIAQLRKTREDNDRVREALNEDTDRKGKVLSLDSLYVGYRTKLKNAPPEPKLSVLVNAYKDKIEVASKKALATIASMEKLLDDDLCVFKNQDEIPTAITKAFDGGQIEFVEKVGKRKFNDTWVKNPMSLFRIDVNGNVKPPKGPSAEQKAAIGLNCFLTGRNKSDPNDGQHVLKGKIKSIRKAIKRVSTEAQALAGAFKATNIPQFSQKHLELRERLEEDTLIAPWRLGPALQNANYWAKDLSVHKRPGAAKVAFVNPVFHYGMDFDVQGLIKSFPINNNIATLLPDKYGAQDLPGHFIGIYKWFQNVGEDIPRTGFAGRTSFTERAGGMLAADYSVINAYGLSLQNAHGLGLALGGKGGIPVGIPAWLGDFAPADFVKLNNRIWAWFLSRIVGKIPTGTAHVPLENALYQQQNVNMIPTDLFSKPEVFIDVLFDETAQFIQDSNRSLIALYALDVLEKYKEMSEALYTLKPADYKAFLNQAPTALSTFFTEVERILAAQASITDIKAGTGAQVDAWRKIFISPAIKAGIAAFAGAAPLAGSLDGTLDQPGNSRWGLMQAKAAGIEALRVKIKKQITLIP